MIQKVGLFVNNFYVFQLYLIFLNKLDPQI